MNRKTLGVFGAFALLAALAMPVSVSGARPAARFHRIDVSKVDTSLLQIANRTRVAQVIVELAGRPVALHQRDALSSGRELSKAERAAVRAQLKTSQDRLLPQLRSLGARVLGQYQDAYNGIKVSVAVGQLQKLSALPGVIGVHRVASYEIENTFGVPYIGAPSVWTSPGKTGAGIKIGIIDTGIDYYHANFGGSGDPADFANADGLGTDGIFPTAKVAGGYDFVGDAYTGSNTPVPDSDPLDCNGHGSHVAGTAAGFGVLSTGATYTGLYNTSTISGNSWNVGPGVAPEATLFAYRVFGCSGSTNVVIDAINRAVIDGMDVINMSLGSPFGEANDPDAVASNNASLAGTMVVASAGNSGPNAQITGSPAAADRALSVAALDVSQIEVGQIDVSGNPYGMFDPSVNPLPITQVVSDRLATPTTLKNGCAAADFTGLPASAIAVVTRGACTFNQKGTNAQAAGASALIVVNTTTGTFFPGGVDTLSIPVFIFDIGSTSALIAADTQTHTIIDTFVQSPTYKQITTFSSGGPRHFDNAVKPEIAAPGANIVSTLVGSGTGGTSLSGTSMAAPHTTGAAALVIQAHPTWTPEQVKAALIDTANATSGAGGLSPYNLRLAGSGVVDTVKAVGTVAFATTSGGSDTLSYGYEPHDAAYNETLPITITNTSGGSIKYNLGTAFNGSAQGLGVTFSAGSVTVPAHGSKTVNVKVLLNSAALAALTSETSIQQGLENTIRGAVVATPTVGGAGRYPLRIPFLVAPRGLSNVQAGSHTAYSLSGDVASASIPLTNPALTAHAGIADVYAWGISDANNGFARSDIRAAGVQTFPGGGDALLVFAMNTWGRWGSPSQIEFDVAIDTDRNDTADFYVIGYDFGLLTTGLFDGELASFVFDADFNLITAYSTAAPMNGSTVELPVFASDLGLSSGNSSFDYVVDTFNLFSGEFDAPTGVGHFDALAPAISQGNYLSVNRNATVALPVSVNETSFNGGNDALGWMIVTLDDANGAAQADLVPVGSLP
jgi:minor extracellular serine protease Vpr